MFATPISYLRLLCALLFSIVGCADYPVSPRSHSLDYLELHDPSGWVLHIDGDGGGKLACRQFPGRRVIYLPATFKWQQSLRRIVRCGESISFISPDCPRAVYYSQAANNTVVCHCPDKEWLKSYFNLAFSEIRRSPAERKDRRILKKAWLSGPPMATLSSQ